MPERCRDGTERDELDPFVAGHDPAQLIRPHTDHHPRSQFEHLIVGVELTGAFDRDVDLLLVPVVDAHTVCVIRVASQLGGSANNCIPQPVTPNDARARRAIPP